MVPKKDAENENFKPEKEEIKAEKLVASLDVPALQKMKISELYAIAKELKIEEMTTLEKSDLIYKIMQLKTNDEGAVACEGILERLPDGYGFLRVNNYLPSSEDIYVSSAQIRKFSLLTGDCVMGLGRKLDHALSYGMRLRVFAVCSWLPAIPALLVGFIFPIFHVFIYQLVLIFLAWKVQKLI